MVVSEMIVVQELSISQGDKTLVRCPELVILSGEVTAVVGANGSGKTTLLNFDADVRENINHYAVSWAVRTQ